MRAAICCIVLLGGCERTIERLDFERMREQQRLDVYDAVPTFPDGSTMRAPPPGTVPWSSEPRDLAREEGMQGSVELDEIPIAIDRALLERGRDRFDRFCAACHGVLGTGNPAVVENARLRPPPSLHEPHIRVQPPGRIYRTIHRGFGLMPAYAAQLDVRDRWAVVAYLRVLWRSQDASLDSLTPALRIEAEAALAEQGEFP
jgi:mono/diheme cytochrome c family protein